MQQFWFPRSQTVRTLRRSLTPRALAAGRGDVAFAVRTIVAGFVAFFIARLLGLEEAQWAMMTVFIVAQPFAGMVVAKGVYRALGTVVGSLVAIGMVGAFGHNPILFAVALAVWFGACTFTFSLLRNPEAYGAVLAGYTVLLIALPGYLAPAMLHDLAAARCTEILLGIACAGIGSRLVMPQMLQPVLQRRLGVCMRDLARYAAAVLDHDPNADRAALGRKLIEDSQALLALRAYAMMESPVRVTRNRAIRQVMGHLLAAMSAASLLDAHVRHPRASGVAAVVQQITGALRQMAALADDRSFDAVAVRLQEAEATISARQTALAADDEATLIEAAAMTVLADLVDALLAALTGFRALASGRLDGVAPRAVPLAVHRDLRTAGENAIRAGLATGALLAAWLLTTGTPEIAMAGVATVVLVAVTSGLFATMPNPGAAILTFLRGTLLCIPFSFVIGQLLLPNLPGPVWLVVLMTPVLLVGATLMARPRTVGSATAFAIFFIALLNPQETVFAPIAFAAGTAGAVLGQFLGIGVFRVVLPPSARRVVRRITRAMCAELRGLCIAPSGPGSSRLAFESRAYDRINQLLPHFGAPGAGAQAALQSGLALLTLGLQLHRLRAERLAPAERARVDATTRSLGTLLERSVDPPTAAAWAGDARRAAADLASRRTAAVALRIAAAALIDHAHFLADPAPSVTASAYPAPIAVGRAMSSAGE